MSQKPIDNLTLERLAAGALGENETLEVMERLRSEDGGMERLQTLLQKNEEFFEKYPARVVLPQIRDQYMREQRRASQGVENMSTLTIMKGAGLAFGVAGLVGVGFYFGGEPSSKTDAVAVAPVVQGVDNNPSAPLGIAESASSSTAGPTKHDEAKKQAERTEFLPLLELDEMILVEGEQRRFEAKGVSRVGVEISELISTSASEDNATLVFEGLKSGITGMQVHTRESASCRESAGVKHLYVRVGQPYGEELQDKMQTEFVPSFEECAQSLDLKGELHARVVLDRKGAVLRVQWDHESTDSDELKACVQDAIEAREFPAMDPPEITVARLKFSS